VRIRRVSLFVRLKSEEDNMSKKNPKPTPKFGGKGGRTDYSKLADSKKIPTKGGFK
jgi:hypothetical protein